MIREPIRYVVYQRTSTGRQGKGGLGMDAQYAAVVEFVRRRGGTIVAQYTRSRAAIGQTGPSWPRLWNRPARARRPC
jgi:hypothetical protein